MESVFVDLGLPSGTLWMRDIFEHRYTKNEAEDLVLLPTKAQVQELLDLCKWSLHKMKSLDIHSFKVTGLNGNAIHFPMPWNMNTYLHKVVPDYGAYLLQGGIYEDEEDERNKKFSELIIFMIHSSDIPPLFGYGRADGRFLIKGVK